MYVIIATCVWGWYNVVIMHTILVEATYAKLASHVWSINEVTVRKSHFNTAYTQKRYHPPLSPSISHCTIFHSRAKVEGNSISMNVGGKTTS